MRKLALLFLLGLAASANAQWGGAGRFYWSKQGSTTKTDSLRFIQGTGATLTQSGNTLTIEATGTGVSIGSARANTGWTAQGAAIAKDTVVARIEWGGTANASAKYFDADNDSVNVRPQNDYPVEIKDGSTRLFGVDSTGWVYKSDMLEFLGGALKETASAGASDTTANYMPMKAFSVGDTATFDIFLSKRFASLDSIVVYAYSNTATSAVVFNCGVRQTAVGDAIAGAFNTAATKTISTGTAGTLRQWSMTSFGSLTASTPSMLRGKIYRTTGGTGGDIFVTRVLIYGVGLR